MNVVWHGVERLSAMTSDARQLIVVHLHSTSINNTIARLAGHETDIQHSRSLIIFSRLHQIHFKSQFSVHVFYTGRQTEYRLDIQRKTGHLIRLHPYYAHL